MAAQRWLSMNKRIVILLIITIIAVLLRFWQLGQVPPSPDWDEAALGYNAYSILETGRDEYGTLLPVILRSFDDYKPGLYGYLTVPSIWLFDLNVWAVRLPSALIGSLTVVMSYFLVIELFRVGGGQKQRKLAYLTAFLLAISPWHLQFSRIAFESNVGLAFNIFALWAFLVGLRKQMFLFISAIFFSLSLYVYQSEKVFVPMLLLVLLIVFFEKLWNLKGKVALVIGVFLISSAPFIYATFSNPDALLRAKGVSVFADQTPFLEKTIERLIRDKEAGDYLGLILDNRRVKYSFEFAKGYLSHFDLNWLFIAGDQPRHQPPGFGHLYLIELPFMLAGIYSLLFGNCSRKTKKLIFAWFLIAPLPAAFTTGVPHPIRTLNFLPLFQIFTALGLLSTYYWVSGLEQKLRYAVSAIFAVLFIFNFLYYVNQYFVQQNYFLSQVWQYGYREAVVAVEEVQDKYSTIVVTNKPHLDQSYIFFLFYTKYDPEKYQAAGGTVTGGFAETHGGFGKYNFRPINWSEETKDGNTLYVGRPEDFPGSVKVLKEIKFLDGTPAIKIVEG